MSESVAPKEVRKYRRPSAPKIEGAARRKALAEYVDHYSKLAAIDRALLNQKLPRKAFQAVLDKIGGVLLEEAKRMSTEDPLTTEFLERNSTPACLGPTLTPEIRTFALLLNALSQWTTAEKLAMDRFVFSGNVRQEIRALAKTCMICPDALDPGAIELHHPVRDGRPPIPLSKKGHEEIEGVVRPDEADFAAQSLVKHKNESEASWVRIRIGCLIELGQLDETEGAYSRSYLSNAKLRSRRAKEATGLSAVEILAILDRYDLGALPS